MLNRYTQIRIVYGYHHLQFKRKAYLRADILASQSANLIRCSQGRGTVALYSRASRWAGRKRDYHQRAYSDLEGEGLVETVQGKGCFVSQQNKALLRERRMRHVEDLMAQATAEARDIGLTRDQLHDMLDLMVPEDLE